MNENNEFVQDNTDTMTVNDTVVNTDISENVQQVDNSQVLVPKKKNNKTLIIVIIFIAVVGGAMLLMLKGNNDSVYNGDEEDSIKKVNVDVGTAWGNLYYAYMEENKSDMDEYEISFIDFNYDNVPEMLLKYDDANGVVTLKVLYIVEKDVYETKWYHDFKICYIYSLKDKSTDGDLYLTTSKQYGTYTMLSNIVDSMAFDSDIKATNDNELIKFGKNYYNTDYQPVFYYISKDERTADFKDFVAKFDAYNQKVNTVKEEVETKYIDYVVKEEVEEKVVEDIIYINGRKFSYGNYYAHIILEESNFKEEYIGVITLVDDSTIIVNGRLFNYTLELNKDKGIYHIVAGDHIINLVANDVIDFDGFRYVFNSYK